MAFDLFIIAWWCCNRFFSNTLLFPFTMSIISLAIFPASPCSGLLTAESIIHFNPCLVLCLSLSAKGICVAFARFLCTMIFTSGEASLTASLTIGNGSVCASLAMVARQAATYLRARWR